MRFDFHGVALEVTADDPECRACIERDFSMFRVTDAEARDPVQIRVLVSHREPPYDRIPAKKRALIRTKDAAVYECGRRRFLDSSGRGLVILDFESESSEIYSLDRDLLHEKSYLMIMSRVGVWLDRRGLHRIHAMGVVLDGRSLLCVMPMGGGKTTLALGLLEKPGSKLLSDEAPLVGGDGRLHPFPVRLGVDAETKLAIPEEFLTSFRRSRRKPKTLIDSRYFSERISGVAEPGILFVGRRTNDPTPRIQPIGRFATFTVLWEMCVRARGIPQLMEYVLRARPRTLFEQFLVYLSRLRAAIRLLRRSECYRLELSNDASANAALVQEFALAPRVRPAPGGSS